MKKYVVPFSAQEREELAKANAIRQRVKAQRRKRQADHDEGVRLQEEGRRRREEAIAKARRESKEDFDNRVRTVLLGLSASLQREQVGIIMDGGDPLNRIEFATMCDTKDGPHPNLNVKVYWVYGKGFEWN